MRAEASLFHWGSSTAPGMSVRQSTVFSYYKTDRRGSAQVRGAEEHLGDEGSASGVWFHL
jgi:hypothetical protein